MTERLGRLEFRREMKKAAKVGINVKNLPFRVVWCDIEERRAKESIKRMWYVTSQNCKTMPREIIKSKLTRCATSYGKESPLSSYYSSP